MRPCLHVGRNKRHILKFKAGGGGVISKFIQKIIHSKYIFYTYLNIFTNIPSTIHYTVYSFSKIIGRFIKRMKRNVPILQNKQEGGLNISPPVPVLLVESLSISPFPICLLFLVT